MDLQNKLHAIEAELRKPARQGSKRSLIQGGLLSIYQAYPAALAIVEMLNNATRVTGSANVFGVRQSAFAELLRRNRTTLEFVNSVLERLTIAVRLAPVGGVGAGELQIRVDSIAKPQAEAGFDANASFGNTAIALTVDAGAELRKLAGIVSTAPASPRVLLLHHSLTKAKELINAALRKNGHVTAFVQDPRRCDSNLAARIRSTIQSILIAYDQEVLHDVHVGNSDGGGSMNVYAYDLTSSARATLVEYENTSAPSYALWGYYVYCREHFNGILESTIRTGHSQSDVSLLVTGPSGEFSQIASYVQSNIQNLMGPKPWEVIAWIKDSKYGWKKSVIGRSAPPPH